MAPSPITAITFPLSFFRYSAVEIPKAAEMEVLACPVPKTS